MPWHFGRNEVVVCTAGCDAGFMLCTIDHDSQPPNETDTDTGEPFYRCPNCEWMVPDPFQENPDAGPSTLCEECQAGERHDTYDGPCDECGTKKRPSAYRDYPADLIQRYRAVITDYLTSWFYACDKCTDKKIARLVERTEQAEREQAERERVSAERAEFARKHPYGTCDACRRVRPLAIVDHEHWIYVCLECAPDGHMPAELLHDEAPTAAGAPPGWYPDPELGDGYLRYWSGQSWSGEPTPRDVFELA